jgi:hypothetical protein
MEDDGFVLVKPKKGKRRRNPPSAPQRQAGDEAPSPALNVRTVLSPEVVVQRVNTARLQLESSELLKEQTLKTLAVRFRCQSFGKHEDADESENAKVVHKIVCLGLGSPSQSNSAVLQLAFVLLLR